MYVDTQGLTPSLFVLLRDLIHERAGLFFEEHSRAHRGTRRE